MNNVLHFFFNLFGLTKVPVPIRATAEVLTKDQGFSMPPAPLFPIPSLPDPVKNLDVDFQREIKESITLFNQCVEKGAAVRKSVGKVWFVTKSGNRLVGRIVRTQGNEVLIRRGHQFFSRPLAG